MIKINIDGEDFELKMEILAKMLYESLKLLYFDMMLRCRDASFDESKKSLLRVVEGVLDRTHDKYEDHLESLRKDIFGEATSEVPDA